MSIPISNQKHIKRYIDLFLNFPNQRSSMDLKGLSMIHQTESLYTNQIRIWIPEQKFTSRRRTVISLPKIVHNNGNGISTFTGSLSWNNIQQNFHPLRWSQKNDRITVSVYSVNQEIFRFFFRSPAEKRKRVRTYTPPATPPAIRDLQILMMAWLGALTPSLANFASSARFTIVETAADSVVFTSSDAID